MSAHDSAVERTRAELAAALPGWHVWYVSHPFDPAGPYSWSAMPKGAGKAAVTAYEAGILITKAREWRGVIHGHIKRTAEELAQCGSGAADQPRRKMLEADLAAYERLA